MMLANAWCNTSAPGMDDLALDIVDKLIEGAFFFAREQKKPDNAAV